MKTNGHDFLNRSLQSTADLQSLANELSCNVQRGRLNRAREQVKAIQLECDILADRARLFLTAHGGYEEPNQ
jgi:hypothetical protein